MFTGAQRSAQDTYAPQTHSRALRWMWALGLLLAAASPVHAQAPNDGGPPQSPWTRDTLGGDWGGMRSAFGQQGIRFNFWATGFYQHMFTGTGNDGGDLSGRVDLMINADTGKLGLWQGGGLHAHVTYWVETCRDSAGERSFRCTRAACCRWMARTRWWQPRSTIASASGTLA